MIFVFKTPVQVAPRRAVLVYNSETWTWNHGVVHIYTGHWTVTVPLGNIRYWREEDAHDDPKQTADKEE